MIARAIIFYSFLAGLLAGPAIPAQDTKDAAKPENARFGNPTSIGRGVQGNIFGIIKEINPKEVVLDKTKFGVDQTIQLDSKTKYFRDGKSSSFDKLKIGDQVYVDAKTNKKTKVMTARRVVSGVIAAP